ncbi:hypothetical protein ACQKWADRAFT_289830 [Trichoderma austrokoningii]
MRRLAVRLKILAALLMKGAATKCRPGISALFLGPGAKSKLAQCLSWHRPGLTRSCWKFNVCTAEKTCSSLSGLRCDINGKPTDRVSSCAEVMAPSQHAVGDMGILQ